MALVLEYVTDERVYRAQQLVVAAEDWSTAEGKHYRRTLIWVLLLLAACYTAIKAQMVVMLIAFAVALIVLLFESVPYSRLQRRAIDAATKGLAPKRIGLVADEGGLRETVEDIESFAPWPSVRSFTLFQDVLFIELKARLWAAIPRYGLQSNSASVEQLTELLRAKGVAERRKGDVA